MAEPRNVPAEVWASQYAKHMPDTGNLPNNRSVTWKSNQYLMCSGKTEVEMGPKPNNCMGAVAWIEKYYEKMGDGLDACKNIPVPDGILHPKPEKKVDKPMEIIRLGPSDSMINGKYVLHGGFKG